MKKIILFGFAILLLMFIAGCGSGTTGNAVNDGGGQLKIPLSDLSSTVKFYEFNDGGVIIKYFAVLGSDGVPRTAFDACDVCGGYKGYQQKGTDIFCRNCGRYFSIDGLGTQNKGYGCWPSYLPHSVEGDNILININDIRKERAKFA